MISNVFAALSQITHQLALAYHPRPAPAANTQLARQYLWPETVSNASNLVKPGLFRGGSLVGPTACAMARAGCLSSLVGKVLKVMVQQPAQHTGLGDEPQALPEEESTFFLLGCD